MDRSESGRKGGKETFKRYGVKHFRELGRRGIRSLADRYFQGSIADAMTWLRQRAIEIGLARGVQEKLEKQIANGARTASEELPVILSPDDDISYWRDLARTSKEAQKEIDVPF